MNREILRLAIPNILSNVSIPLLGMVDTALMGRLESEIYIGATASVPMRNMMILSTLGIFLPVYYLTVSRLGNHGLWLALLLFMVARGLTLGLLAKKNIFTISP